MRIIAGEFKGHPLKAPKGDATRPTVDRVRESLMSSINSMLGGFDGCVVLDLFAGSGALGLEALSRGAESACFCEKSQPALAALAHNVSLVGKTRARIVRGDVTRRLPHCAGKPFNLVFLDPPYAMDAEELAGLLVRLDEAGSLAKGALIAYEHDTRQDPLDSGAFASLELGHVARKKYGATIIDLLQMGEQ